jgi:hypothetical protein
MVGWCINKVVNNQSAIINRQLSISVPVILRVSILSF